MHKEKREVERSACRGHLEALDHTPAEGAQGGLGSMQLDQLASAGDCRNKGRWQRQR